MAPATPNERNLELLNEKHDGHHDTLQDLWQATASEVLQVIRSSPSGSAGGPDGFRPDHLKDLVGFKTLKMITSSSYWRTNAFNTLFREICYKRYTQSFPNSQSCAP